MGIYKRAVAILLAVLILSNLFIRVYAFDDVRSASNEEKATERLIRGFEGFEESIDLSDLGIAVSSLPRLFANATKNSPYLFYVNKKLIYTYRGDTVVSVIPKYDMTGEEANEAIDFCKAEVIKIAGLAIKGGNDLERLILAHDVICYRYSYDLTLENNNIYKTIKEGKGTCQGYTWLYMAVLREMGIGCEYVASDSIAHIWLKVKIDGEWYNSDVTWDDPVGDAVISRKHLLFSDAKAENDGYVERYSFSGEECNSDKYDGKWLAEVISSDHGAGDVDHNGVVDLFDLVITLRGEGVCPICSDTDRDLILSGGDVEMIRELILTKQSE